MKSAGYVLLFILTQALCYSAAPKIRAGLSAGYGLIEELSKNTLFLISPCIAIVYPVSDKKNIMNTEISIVLSLNRVFSQPQFDSLSFGFGIRFFYNDFHIIRPYFTHEIKSQLTWIQERTGMGKTFHVLLGLGLDIPLRIEDPSMESSSVFFDVNYLFYDLGFFEADSLNFKSIFISTGINFII